jgi:hypothetical protein
MSLTCIASPWRSPVENSPVPSSSTTMEPYTISSLPSASTSATDRLWFPWPENGEAVGYGNGPTPIPESKTHLEVR